MFSAPPPPSEEELQVYKQQANNVIKQAVYIAVALWTGKSKGDYVICSTNQLLSRLIYSKVDSNNVHCIYYLIYLTMFCLTSYWP
jgi:Mitochondrial import receptor subunit or translocase